ncbi:PREDICTED: melanoma-associated antigen B1-like [Chrysochloris asiatica]|uniref:Melanoma-associated antigen B1-like n=1 Tax=Chrysochloris asiatica TaxID=185453 RepID=A0A9B0WJB2_CHRAS|nr:PREDICTED: melanoma-associated antigen B1-like [Chrysochloris asiatica]
MPRGQKSKLRAREKRERARIETQGLQGSEASATKVSALVQFMSEMYKNKQPIMMAELQKVLHKKYKEESFEILKRAMDRMEVVFGLELKEINPNSNYYYFASKLNIAKGRSLTGGSGLPKSGLVMVLLGVIFMNGNRASEDEIWEFLNALGIYAGQMHSIFGEPRKFITKDLVMERFLVYRKVPKSDPPCNEFLWGPRAYAETTKMKVLQVLAKINNTDPSSFPVLYEEALRDEEERAQARAVNDRAGVRSKGK